MPSVAVFLNQHMPLSEVFVAQQAQTLTRYAPTLVVCRQVQPSAQHDLPTVVLNRNNTLPEKLSEELFKTTGYSPILKTEVAKHDLIHAHFGPTGWMASHLALQTKRPLVVTCHGSDITKRNLSIKNDGVMQTLYAATRHILAKRADKFICVSQYLKQRAIEFGFPEEKCVVNYMGIPLIAHSEPKYVRPDASDTPFRILAVGRLVEIKGHRKLIEAVAAVQQAGYNVQLDIVGNGPLREILEKQAASSLHHYKFWGGQPHSQITSLMRNSDIFCHSSISLPNGQTEAFGLVISEAQWAGLPVVVFKSGGIPEGMKDGETGFLCPEGDIQSMKNAICTLIDNSQLRHSMSVAAQDFILHHFDGAAHTAKLETIYDSVCSAHQK